MEDTGTALAPCIPWSLSGAFYSTTLGVPVMEFVIFAPMTYLSVVFELIYSITGFKIAHAGDKQKKLKKDKDQKDSKEETA